jgi:hypothetical protein
MPKLSTLAMIGSYRLSDDKSFGGEMSIRFLIIWRAGLRPWGP